MEERYYSERYFWNCPIDLTSNNPRTYAIKKSGSGKKILEIGTSTGEISQILQENGNIVTGIEIDVAAAKKAERFCSRMITGNVEEMDFSLLFGENKFDVIILTDVIEHLIWPEKLLKRLHQLLDKLGFLIISIPNFCHKDILLNLMRGDFHYTNIGLLDATHLRFFGLKNICDLFKNSKFEIRDMNKIIMEKTEQSDPDIFVPESLKSFIDSIPESNVYQYVFLAYPSDEQNDYPLPTYSLSQIYFEARILEEGKRIKKLETNLSELNQIINQFKKKNSELENKNSELENKNSELENKNSELERVVFLIITLPVFGRFIKFFLHRIHNISC